jgi:DNA-damage-inducible protein J
MDAEFTNLNVRMDKEIKKQADQLFGDMGMNLSTAINIFLRQVIRTGSIPFKITVNTNDDQKQYNLSLRKMKLAESQTVAKDPGNV